MRRYLFIVLAIVCFACKEQKQTETIVVESSESSKPVKIRDRHFEKITFSVMQTWGGDKFDKDIAILNDSTFYYRLRGLNDFHIKANYVGKLDSLQMSKVYAILDSVDFNTLKYVEHDGEDMPYFSVLFSMYNGELKIKGTLNEKIYSHIENLRKLVEAQKMVQSDNHKFSTAKDVLIPPPGVVYTEAELDSL